MTHPLVNFLAFQVCWFACVGGAARGLPWIGPLTVAAFVAAHLWSTPRGRLRAAQAWLLGLTGAIGYVADSLLVISGVLRFPPQAALGGPAALWMVALWMVQAATFSGAMSWMAGRFTVGAVFGAIGGPLAYLAGERMGAAFLGPTHAVAIGVVAVEWGLAMPLLLWIERRARSGLSTARLETPGPLVS